MEDDGEPSPFRIAAEVREVPEEYDSEESKDEAIDRALEEIPQEAPEDAQLHFEQRAAGNHELDYVTNSREAGLSIDVDAPADYAFMRR